MDSFLVLQLRQEVSDEDAELAHAFSQLRITIPIPDIFGL